MATTPTETEMMEMEETPSEASVTRPCVAPNNDGGAKVLRRSSRIRSVRTSEAPVVAADPKARKRARKDFKKPISSGVKRFGNYTSTLEMLDEVVPGNGSRDEIWKHARKHYVKEIEEAALKSELQIKTKDLNDTTSYEVTGKRVSEDGQVTYQVVWNDTKAKEKCNFEDSNEDDDLQYLFEDNNHMEYFRDKMSSPPVKYDKVDDGFFQFFEVIRISYTNLFKKFRRLTTTEEE